MKCLDRGDWISRQREREREAAERYRLIKLQRACPGLLDVKFEFLPVHATSETHLGEALYTEV